MPGQRSSYTDENARSPGDMSAGSRSFEKTERNRHKRRRGTRKDWSATCGEIHPTI